MFGLFAVAFLFLWFRNRVFHVQLTWPIRLFRYMRVLLASLGQTAFASGLRVQGFVWGFRCWASGLGLHSRPFFLCAVSQAPAERSAYHVISCNTLLYFILFYSVLLTSVLFYSIIIFDSIVPTPTLVLCPLTPHPRAFPDLLSQATPP